MRGGIVASALILLASSAAAQQDMPVEFSSSPNPVGSGARALGMASAFIATADDATAASWNPGALIILERPEASLVLSLKNRNEFFGGVGVADGEEVQRYTYPGLNYLSGAYPFKIEHRYFVASLSFQTLIDFDKRIRKTEYLTQRDGPASYAGRYRQKGSITSLSPALAFQLRPDLAIGFTVNISTDKLGYPNGWRQNERVDKVAYVGSNLEEETLIQRQDFSFNGVSGNVGVLWDITPRWTLGAVIKTPMWGSVTRTIERFTDDDTDVVDPGSSYSEPLVFPPSYGVGVAYRYSDALTISGDVYRTEWSLFRHEITNLRTGEKNAVNPISSRSTSDPNVPGITQIHVGAEQLFVFQRTVVAARGGLFYDPEPADGRLNHFVGGAIGTGVSIGDAVVDVAYQFRGAAGALTDTGGTESTAVSSADDGSVWQHLLYASVIYYF